MKQLIAIFLTLLMLATHIGLSIGTHYCGGKAVKSSISLAQADLSCGMTNMDAASCEQENHASSFKKKACCENAYTSFSVDTDYNNSIANTVLPITVKFIAAFVVSFVQYNFFLFQERNQAFTAHSPPLIEQDKSVLFQVFRI